MVKTLSAIQELWKTQVWSLGREDPLGGEHGNPLQYSCLENPMDRGAWWATVHGVTKSRTWVKWLSSHSSVHNQGWSSPALFSVCLFCKSHDFWGRLLCSAPYLYITNSIILKAQCLSLSPKQSLLGKTLIADLKYMPTLHWSCDLSMVFDRPGLVPKSTSWSENSIWSPRRCLISVVKNKLPKESR